MAVEVESGRFTVGVFQDIAWAEKGLAALTQAGFAPDVMTVMAKESDQAASLFPRVFGAAGERLEIAGVGPTLVKGSHGAPAIDPQQRGVLLASQRGVFVEGPTADTDVADIVLRQFGI